MLARALLLGSLVAVPAIVYAQPADKTKTAKQYVDAGLAAQDAGDYDTAISLYEKAYALVPHPVLVFNMAQAQRLAKHDDKALELYEKYLAADPNGTQAKKAREIVADMKAKRAEAEKAAADAKAAESARIAAEAARIADEKRAAEAKRAQAERAKQVAQTAPVAGPGAPPSPADTVEHPGRALRIAGIGVGAVGVVGVGVGIVFGLKARSLADDFQPGMRFDPDKDDEGERANRTAIIGIAGGVVLVAVGATLYWRGHVAKHRAEVSLVPMISDQVAGLAFTGVLP